MTREEAAKQIVESGLPHPEQLARMLAPSVRIQAVPIGTQPLALGESRFGGVPDVPAGFEWPQFEGTPLAFLGLIDLREIDGIATSVAVPADGFLLFFYATEAGRWGFDPADAGSSRVLYVPHGDLSRVEPTEGVLGSNGFRPCRLRFEAGWELPDMEGHSEALPFDLRHDGVWEAFDSLRETFDSDGPSHHLGGHPQPVQGEMGLECQLVTNGLYCGDATGYDDPRRAALEPGASDWVLLLQIDTDEDGPDWMWGDCGMLYFWIRRQDAQAGAFDRAWTILQCG